MSAGVSTASTARTLREAGEVAAPRASSGRSRVLNPLLIAGFVIVGLVTVFVVVYPMVQPVFPDRA